MNPENTLNEGNPPQKLYEGDESTNLETEKKFRYKPFPDIEEEITLKKSKSVPDERGVYKDTEVTTVLVDRFGTPYPEDPRAAERSWSDLVIPSPEQKKACNSWFHSRNLSTSILVGQDGRETPTGAICSRCESCINSFYLLGVLAGLAVVVGVLFGSISIFANF